MASSAACVAARAARARRSTRPGGLRRRTTRRARSFTSSLPMRADATVIRANPPKGPDVSARCLDLLRSSPPFRRMQDDHRPPRSRTKAVASGLGLNRRNVVEHRVERRGHARMHICGVVTFDEERRVAITSKQIAQLFVRHARQNRRIRDLPTVQVQIREHGAVLDRVQELVGVPARAQWTRLGLPVADDAGHGKIRIVVGRAVGMRERVAELAPSGIEPGVSAAQWLGIPPGNENCLKRRAIPAPSLDTSG